MAAAASAMEWTWPTVGGGDSSKQQQSSGGSSNPGAGGGASTAAAAAENGRPLELQFLPPSACTAEAAAAAGLPSSWGEDPSRLQRLMMGSLAAPAAFPPPTSTSASSTSASPSPSASASSSSITTTSTPMSTAPLGHSNGRLSPPVAVNNGGSQLPDLGALFDFDSSKPLPSGWERCLDLKSGQMFVKKSEVDVAITRSSSTIMSKDWKPSAAKASLPPASTAASSASAAAHVDKAELKQDWSLKWALPKAATPPLPLPPASMSQETPTLTFSKSFALVKSEEIEADDVKPDLSKREEPLCLDLNLKLTSQTSIVEAPVVSVKRERPFPANEPMFERQFTSSTSVIPAFLKLKGGNMVQQQWKWNPLGPNERPIVSSSIQEMVKESTMATAACPKCLMYVLVKKSSPVCPRCSNLICLDSTPQQPPLGKRPRLDLTPNDLSLSTEKPKEE